MGSTQNILLWAIAILPGCIYFFVWFAYNRILAYKRKEIASLMRGGNAFQLYIKAFGGPVPITNKPDDELLRATVDSLFDLYYHWRSYALPIVINTLLTIVAGVITLTWSGLHVAGVPIDIEVLVRRLPSVVIAACAGAFIWGLYDILSRYQSVDLSTVSLHFIWWRLLMAPLLGYLVSLPFSEPMKPLIGFVIGAFPVRTLRDYIKGLAKKNINIDADAHPSEEPTLHKIQGMTKDMIDNLYGEGIQSTAHLAQADPIKLLLRTNIEWKLILDIIDQSILFNYVRDKLTVLRPIGIRGAIEVATIGDDLEDENGEIQSRAEEVIKLIASKLQEQEEGVYCLIATLYDDPQVDFVWGLWGEAIPVQKRSKDESSQTCPAQEAKPQESKPRDEARA